MANGSGLLGVLAGLAVGALLVAGITSARSAQGMPNLTFNMVPSGSGPEKAAAGGGGRQLTGGGSGGAKTVKTKQVLKSRTSPATTTLFPGAAAPQDLSLVRPGGE